MLRKRIFTVISFLFAFACFRAGTLTAQPTGFPAGSRAAHRLTVTAVAAYTKHDFAPFAYELPVYLVRVTYGLTSWLDLALLGGATDLRAEHTAESRSWWSEGYKPVAGIGIWLDPLRLGPLSTYVASTVLGYTNRGAHWQEEVVEGERRVAWDATEQRIGELIVTGGLGLELGNVRLYGGAGIGQWWRRVEVTQELHRSGEKVVLGHNVETYSGEPTIRPLGGVELRLPHRLFLSFEASARSADDLWISVGIGQTGSPD